ncbi:MAG: DUF2029 domain-containing protein [Sandaracinaceae bacterium]|nr:DUF2029 domain-containing protein [Sandaracinaceae bacterium]
MGRRALTVRAAIAIGVLAAVVGGTAWLGLDGPPRADVPRWLAGLGLSSLGVMLAGLLVARLDRRRLVAVTLASAAALRLAAACAPVSLSDDVNRYAWDGALTASGHDPYAHRPEDVIGWTAGTSRERFERLNSPRYYTVYPPLAQASFAVAAAAEPWVDATLALRLVFAGFDLLAVWALFGLLRRLDRDPRWALLYAWNPLVYWEVAAGGHTEALLVPMLVLAACAALDGRGRRAGLFLGLAASGKLTALVAAPLLVVYLAHRLGLARALRAAGVAALALGAGFLPFASPTLIPHLRESLGLFGARFSFNAPVYYAMRDGMGYVEGLRPSVDPVLMPALAVATLLGLALVVFLQDGSRSRFVTGVAFSFLALMLFARVVHPWYLLPALAFGVAARSPTLVLASALLPLSYLRYHPFGHEEPWVIALEFLPVLALLLVEGVLRATASVAPSERDALAPPSNPPVPVPVAAPDRVAAE